LCETTPSLTAFTMSLNKCLSLDPAMTCHLCNMVLTNRQLNHQHHAQWEYTHKY